MIETPIWNKRAIASVNEKFIWIAPQAGYRMAILDLDSEERMLSPNAPDEEVGEAIQSALKESKFLSLEEFYAFQTRADLLYSDWVKKMITRYNYRSKQAFFKEMKRCNIVEKEGVLAISPSHHNRMDSWSRSKIDDIEDVFISTTSSVAEIGAALRLAFSRCTS
ncbi:contact-dependent growth inhibition system immunity protein [Burkholderia contaminans]|uniref:contact-dependent growth inhibition system immunity protein n=1 Tax=Burkholderia contaminans TaxID=488447 RepID=UPI002D80FFFB|nr:contact-dependent growth inhibition system immunity protein [Burkholderia contaminans]